MLITVKGTKPWDDIPFHPIKFTFIGTTGELFWVPFYDKSLTPCYSIVFEAKAGGQMDQFAHVKTGQEAVAAAKEVIRQLSPWDYEHVKDAVLTDELAWLKGGFAPTVRKPVAHLPSGKAVMALGDAAISYDPIAAQGANSASKMAHHVLQHIIAREDQPFAAGWMTEMFDAYWDNEAQYMNAFYLGVVGADLP